MARKSELNEPIKALGVGEEIGFPVERIQTVRVLASNLGAVLQRTYSTFRSKDGKTVRVKRIS